MSVISLYKGIKTLVKYPPKPVLPNRGSLIALDYLLAAVNQTVQLGCHKAPEIFRTLNYTSM